MKKFKELVESLTDGVTRMLGQHDFHPVTENPIKLKGDKITHPGVFKYFQHPKHGVVRIDQKGFFTHYNNEGDLIEHGYSLTGLNNNLAQFIEGQHREIDPNEKGDTVNESIEDKKFWIHPSGDKEEWPNNNLFGNFHEDRIKRAGLKNNFDGFKHGYIRGRTDDGCLALEYDHSNPKARKLVIDEVKKHTGPVAMQQHNMSDFDLDMNGKFFKNDEDTLKHLQPTEPQPGVPVYEAVKDFGGNSYGYWYAHDKNKLMTARNPSKPISIGNGSHIEYVQKHPEKFGLEPWGIVTGAAAIDNGYLRISHDPVGKRVAIHGVDQYNDFLPKAQAAIMKLKPAPDSTVFLDVNQGIGSFKTKNSNHSVNDVLAANDIGKLQHKMVNESSDRYPYDNFGADKYWYSPKSDKLHSTGFDANKESICHPTWAKEHPKLLGMKKNAPYEESFDHGNIRISHAPKGDPELAFHGHSKDLLANSQKAFLHLAKIKEIHPKTKIIIDNEHPKPGRSHYENPITSSEHSIDDFLGANDLNKLQHKTITESYTPSILDKHLKIIKLNNSLLRKHQKNQLIVDTNECPECGGKLQQNHGIKGLWQCVNSISDKYRKRPKKKNCQWQGFVE